MRLTRSRMFLLVLAAVILPQFAFGAQTVNVSANDNSFAPQTVNILPGDTVKWINNGKMSHTVSADNGSFDSGALTTGQSYQKTFSTPGTYRYYCAYHGAPGGYGMAGTVVVADSSSSAQQTVVLTQNTAVPPASSGNPAVDALRAQITELINRITTLQQQYGGGVGVGGVPVVGSGAAAQAGVSQCPLISRSLKRGSQGEDVARLQRFLALDPSVYPEAQVSGYYGALTEAAVKRFQCKNKLVCDGSAEGTGYGVTGPRTAALLALQCPDGGVGGGGSVSGFLKVTPLSGPAPLATTIEAFVNGARSCSAATYEVDYGDGSQRTVINVPANYCNEMRQVLNHTYSSPGTYTITLRSGIHQITATVTVGGVGGPPSASTIDTFSATPKTGTSPLTVTFSGTINASKSCNVQYTLHFGDSSSVPFTPSGCNVSTFNVTHIYSGGGTFNARLVRDTGNTEMGRETITVTAAGPAYGEFFSVTPGVGGDVYAVSADFELESACAAYQLNWGDSSALVSQVQGTCGLGTVSKNFSHQYASPGTYTITLKRGSSLGTTHTAGVTISN